MIEGIFNRCLEDGEYKQVCLLGAFRLAGG